MISLKEVKNFKYRINPTEEIVGRANFGYYIVRPISLYLTWLILQTRMSANQVTVLHMVIGLFGSVLLGFAGLKLKLIGIAILYLSYILDNVDGEVARYRKQVSISGKYLDSIAHNIVIMAMFFGFGFGAYLDTGKIELVIFGFLAGFFSLRFDILNMYTEAAQSVESHLDQSYEYYKNIEKNLPGKEELDFQYISKKAGNRLKRLVFAAFAFPGTLNIIALVLLIELILLQFKLEFLTISVNSVALYTYGSLLPLRRFYTIRKIVLNHETERKYLKLRNLGEKD